MRARLMQGRVAVPFALAVLAGVAVVLAISSVGTDPVAGSAERTVTAATGVVQSTVSGSGNLSPANELDLSFGASGEVTKIYVRAGDHVHQGQLLAKIDPSSAEVDLAEAKATLQSAQDALTTASASGGSATVSAPAAQATIRTVALSARAAQEPAADATTTPAPATTTPAPATTTPAPATTTPAPATTTPKAKASTKAKPKATTKAKTTTKARSQSSGASSGGGAGAARTAAGTSGSGSGSGGTSVASATAAVKSAQLSVAKAEKALAATKLHAPLAGTIAAVNGAVGDTVGSGSSASGTSGSADTGSAAAVAGGLGGSGGGSGSGSGSSSSSSSSSGFITLAQLSRYEMDVALSESDIGRVKVGQQATVTVNAASGAQFAARVQRVGVLASSSSGSSAVSYPVTLRLSQTGSKLKAGMSATADVVVSEATGVTVPSQAVQGGSVTLVRDGTRTTQRVQTGVVGDASTQILSGLKAGDEVVVRSASAAAGANASGAGGSGAAGRGGGLGGGGAVLIPGGGAGFGGGGGFRAGGGGQRFRAGP